jgi:hypothetical protein
LATRNACSSALAADEIDDPDGDGDDVGLAAAALAATVAHAGGGEGRHARRDDRRRRQEGQRIGDRDEQPAAQQGQERAEPAEDGLGALRSARDLVVDEVWIQRAVRLVGDEVSGEEHRNDHRRGGDRMHEAEQRQRHDERRRGGDDERQSPADGRAQPIRPRPDDERQPKRHESFAADQQAHDDRGIGEVLGEDREVRGDRGDGEPEREGRHAENDENAPLAALQRPLDCRRAIQCTEAVSRAFRARRRRPATVSEPRAGGASTTSARAAACGTPGRWARFPVRCGWRL